MVVWITVADTHILLGADLKAYARAARGWKAILDEVGVWHGSRASIFKIPHHGSMGSHEPRVWREMLEPDPEAILTPFVQGSTVLPTEDGVAAVKRYTSNAYISSPPRPSLDVAGPVRQVLDQATADYQPIDIEPGRVRMRKPLTAAKWTVEVSPPAAKL